MAVRLFIHSLAFCFSPSCQMECYGQFKHGQNWCYLTLLIHRTFINRFRPVAGMPNTFPERCLHAQKKKHAVSCCSTIKHATMIKGHTVALPKKVGNDYQHTHTSTNTQTWMSQSIPSMPVRYQTIDRRPCVAGSGAGKTRPKHTPNPTVVCLPSQESSNFAFLILPKTSPRIKTVP